MADPTRTHLRRRPRYSACECLQGTSLHRHGEDPHRDYETVNNELTE